MNLGGWNWRIPRSFPSQTRWITPMCPFTCTGRTRRDPRSPESSFQVLLEGGKVAFYHKEFIVGPALGQGRSRGLVPAPPAGKEGHEGGSLWEKMLQEHRGWSWNRAEGLRTSTTPQEPQRRLHPLTQPLGNQQNLLRLLLFPRYKPCSRRSRCGFGMGMRSHHRRLLSGLRLRRRPPLLLPLGGPRTKHQSTLMGCPISSCPFSPSMAACASL